MALFTIDLDSSGFFLDVFLDDINEGFISSFHGQFRKEGVDTVYPKLYWQVINMSVGIERIGCISFALDEEESVEPFTALYNISRGTLREQVAKAMGVSLHDTHYNLMIVNGVNDDNTAIIESDIIALSITKIESIQTLSIGLTAYFSEDDSADNRYFILTLLEAGFHKLDYDGFVDPKATMVFRPQSELIIWDE
jgi:hypothetical protein